MAFEDRDREKRQGEKRIYIFVKKGQKELETIQRKSGQMKECKKSVAEDRILGGKSEEKKRSKRKSGKWQKFGETLKKIL